MATPDRKYAIAFALLLILSIVTVAALAGETSPKSDAQAQDGAPPGEESNAGTAPTDDNASSHGLDDTDEDSLSTGTEMDAGRERSGNDSDGDGLLDRTERRLLPTDPQDPDSDDDGVLDGAEDPDGDGLGIAEELDFGSLYDMPDSDRDGLNDSEERNLGTHPLLPDTDDDGIEDAAELDLGTDPLVNDTDGDGVLDGNEIYTTSVSYESPDVSISFTGHGNVAADASVTNDVAEGMRNDLVNPARATDFARLSVEQSFDTANVTFTYDESALPTNETDILVFRFNRTSQFYDPVPSYRDPAADTITGRTDRTGVYTVLSPSVLAEQFTVDPHEGASYHEDNFTEPPEDCEGVCYVDDGDLVVGPLGQPNGS